MVMDPINLGQRKIEHGQVMSSLARAAMATRTRPRIDAAGNAGFNDHMVDDYRPHWDEEAVALLRQSQRWEPDPEIDDWREDAYQQLIRTDESRADALPVIGSSGFARDFEFIHQTLIEEKRAPLSGLKLFPVDSTLPLGWPTHTFRRISSTGGARWHQQGDSFPVVATGYAEEQFHTGFVVCATTQSFFTGLQLGVTNLRTYESDSRTALYAIDEFMNRVTWYGAPERQIYGVLTHPNVPTMEFPLRFSTSTGLALAAALIDAFNRPIVDSGGVFFPNRIAMDPALAAYVNRALLDSTGGAGAMTVWEFVQKSVANTSGPLTIVLANELTAAQLTANNVGNPAGWGGIFLWNDSREAVMHVMPQSPTFLPVWNSSPIDTIHAAFGSTGGIVMNHVGANLVIFARL